MQPVIFMMADMSALYNELYNVSYLLQKDLEIILCIFLAIILPKQATTEVKNGK